jgi:hypothetical protein
MPPEVAGGDGIDRWHWKADNGIRPLTDFIRRDGPRKGRRAYLAQVPTPGQWPPPSRLGRPRKTQGETNA